MQGQRIEIVIAANAGVVKRMSCVLIFGSSQRSNPPNKLRGDQAQTSKASAGNKKSPRLRVREVPFKTEGT